jgi:ParB family chromosome partitioning protein
LRNKLYKKQFDTLLFSDINKISADTFEIKMIEIDKIIANENNFYSISEIEILAEDIERQGLKSNLVVRKNNEEYVLISGHRRLNAINFLKENNRINLLVFRVF